MSLRAGHDFVPSPLDRMSAADVATDAWLLERTGSAWKWPAMQGAQVEVAGGNSRGSALNQPDLHAEAAQALAALRAGGVIDAHGRRADWAALPATCGDASDDAPALPVVLVARRVGRCLRTVQTRMLRLWHVEREGGQLVLPCVPPVKEVYKARRSDAEVTP